MKKQYPSLIAYTLFCDDIREEQGNKHSAMGIYPTVLVIDGEEQVLSKLVAFTVVEIPKNVTGKTGRIVLMDGEQVLLQGEFDVPMPPPLDENGEAKRMIATMPIEAIPFTAKVGMKLHVRFEFGSFKYNSPILSVVQENPIDAIEVKPLERSL